MGERVSGVFGSRPAVAITSVIVTAVILMGGIALANVPNGSVTSKKIRNGAVKSIDIRNGTVKSIDIRNGTITGTDIKNGTVGPGDLAASARPDRVRVAHSRGNLTLSPDVPVDVTTPIVPSSADDGGFIMLMVDWSAKPAPEELSGVSLSDSPASVTGDGPRIEYVGDGPRIEFVGGSPPCPCSVSGFHQVEGFGEGSVGTTTDVWRGPGSTGGPETFMEFSGSATYVVPAGSDPSVDLESSFLYEATDNVFAGSLDLTYHMTGVFLPFGWDGSQELSPSP